ncbi:MAG: type II secretion system F family protein [Parcubacteria group bacterium]|nr:type II secretion system F family protein [Parcubacteria group bacterium]
MAFYNFQATNSDGQMVSGVVEADSEALALSLIKEENLTPVSVTERRLAPWQVNIDFLQFITTKDLVVMSRQLSVMVDATLPLVDALHILVRQTRNPKLKKIVSEIADDVEGGARLSLACSKYPKIFSKFYLSIIRSGETSGQLAEVLNYLADQLEKDYDLKSKIRSAMIYPVFILSGIFVVGLLMMIFVVPNLTAILTEANVQLPLSTRILIGTSDWLKHFWWLLFIILGLIFGGLRFSLRYPRVRYAVDFARLYIPVLGKLSRQMSVVRIMQSLSTLSAGKVPLVDALAVVKDIVGNAVYENIMNETITAVRDGNSMASVFGKAKQVPDMVSQMIAVGEETGKLDDILKHLTAFYGREIDNLVRNLVALIEPIVMILMGVAVGVMVAAIILPMYTLSTSL